MKKIILMGLLILSVGCSREFDYSCPPLNHTQLDNSTCEQVNESIECCYSNPTYLGFHEWDTHCLYKHKIRQVFKCHDSSTRLTYETID